MLLQSGDVALPALSSARQVLAAATQQALELAQQAASDRQALNALLGLDPDVILPLSGSLPLPPLPAEPRSRLIRRPDLLALQAGYASEDTQLRRAILAQFPALNLGVNQARDTSTVHTIGFGISLSLPLFNATRGGIAVARATRQSLYDDYKARLGEASGEIGALLADQAAGSERKLAVARRWVAVKMSEVETSARLVCSGDDSIVTDFELLAGRIAADAS